MARVAIVIALLFTRSVLCSSFRRDRSLVKFPKISVCHAENSNSTTEYIGIITESWNGDEYSAFRGIPYALPPTGDRRFMDPLPLSSPHVGVIDARFEGNDCPSIYARNPSEDCLLLNVYTKVLSNNSSNTLHSVVVFVHPGGLYIGSGLSSFVGPQYLMAKDVVLVTFNYRLGTLGFLNLGTKDIPGNAGFKDQVLAMRWVKQNIRHFGGNPDDITLMGYSAGALSVSLHLVSPMSKMLFHKAIIMSGSIPPQMRMPVHHQRALATRQVSLLGCMVSGSLVQPEDIVKCLNQFSGKELAKTLRKMFTFGKDNPIFLWLPVVEDDFGQERFLTEDFYEALKAGRFSNVPILTGFTNGELCTSAKDIITQKSTLASFWTKFDKLAPAIFMYEGHNETRTTEITTAIRMHYLSRSSESGTDLRALCNLFSDSVIRFGLHYLTEMVSKHGVTSYTYKFSYRGRHSNFYYPTGTTSTQSKAEHMDDLMYLFKMHPHTFTLDDKEANVVKFMTEFFAQFVKTGKPPNGEMFEFKTKSYADISSAQISIKNGTNFVEAHFWENL